MKGAGVWRCCCFVLAGTAAWARTAVLSNAELIRMSGNVMASGLDTSAAAFSLTGNGTTGVLDWARLNVAVGESLHFGPGTWYNAVSGPEASVIAGQLLGSSANVYLFNPNGIIFNATSAVDVGNLTAAATALQNVDALIDNPSLAPRFGTAWGDVTARGGRFAAGELTFLGHNVALDPTASFAGAVQVGAGDALEIDSVGGGKVTFALGDSSVGSASVAGAFAKGLTVRSADTIRVGRVQADALDLSAGGNVVQDEASEMSVKVLNVSGDDVALANDRALTLARVEARGDFSLSARGDIRQGAPLVCEGRTTLVARDGTVRYDITLDGANDALNAFADELVLEGRAVSVAAAGDLNLRAESSRPVHARAVGGNLTLRSSGDLTLGAVTAERTPEPPAPAEGEEPTPEERAAAADAALERALESWFVDVESAGDLRLSESAVAALGNVRLAAGQRLIVDSGTVEAPDSLTLEGRSVAYADGTLTSGGHVYVEAKAGNIDLGPAAQITAQGKMHLGATEGVALNGALAARNISVVAGGDIDGQMSMHSAEWAEAGGDAASEQVGVLRLESGGSITLETDAARVAARAADDLALTSPGSLKIGDSGEFQVLRVLAGGGTEKVSDVPLSGIVSDGGSVELTADRNLKSTVSGLAVVAPESITLTAGRDILGPGPIGVNTQSLRVQAGGDAWIGFLPGPYNLKGDYTVGRDDVTLDVAGSLQLTVAGTLSTPNGAVLRSNGDLGVYVGAASDPLNVSLLGSRFLGSSQTGRLILAFPDGARRPRILSADGTLILSSDGILYDGAGSVVSVLQGLEALPGQPPIALPGVRVAETPAQGRADIAASDLLPPDGEHPYELEDNALLDFAARKQTFPDSRRRLEK